MCKTALCCLDSNLLKQVTLQSNHFHCTGPSCEEAELSDFSCLLSPVEIWYIKNTHQLSSSRDHPDRPAGCGNILLAATTLHSATIMQSVSTNWHPLTPKMSQHPQAVRNMTVTASKCCRWTCTCQPTKSRPGLYKTRTGTVRLESRSYSTETFKSSWYGSDQKTG